MYRFTIAVANRIVGVESIQKRILVRSHDYLTEATPDFTVHSSQEDIEEESRYYSAINNDPDPMKMDIELSVILKKIAEKLLSYDTLLMHGAAIAINDQAFMFSAPSGTGKSTHVRKWLRNLPEAYVVNGDKPFVITDGIPKVCGTPWAGKERWQTNTIVPLNAIILMQRAQENIITEITFKEAFQDLLQQTYRPKGTDNMLHTLLLLKALDHKVRFYRFRCNNMKPGAFEVAYKALVEKEQENQ